MKIRVLFVKSCSGVNGTFRKGQLVRMELEKAKGYIERGYAIHFDECIESNNNNGGGIVGEDGKLQLGVVEGSGLTLTNNLLGTDTATDEEIASIFEALE